MSYKTKGKGYEFFQKISICNVCVCGTDRVSAKTAGAVI